MDLHGAFGFLSAHAWVVINCVVLAISIVVGLILVIPFGMKIDTDQFNPLQQGLDILLLSIEQTLNVKMPNQEAYVSSIMTQVETYAPKFFLTSAIISLVLTLVSEALLIVATQDLKTPCLTAYLAIHGTILVFWMIVASVIIGVLFWIEAPNYAGGYLALLICASVIYWYLWSAMKETRDVANS